jgi:23S rRNA pseudouridine2605 synthase
MNDAPEKTGERIARRIARAGVCSRRDAEKLVTAGRVAVNGTVISSPALNVSADDEITVDGTALPAAAATRLWRYHKNKGELTTARDPGGRPTVFDKLPNDMPRVIAVGRLDYNTEGLLLLTNDGDLARALELPATGWRRRYRVRAHGTVDEATLAGLARGVTVDGVRYGPIEAEMESRRGANAWFSVAIREGKNREIRKVLEHIGLSVNRLIRVSFGPFQLGALAPGAVEEVPAKAMLEQCGALLPNGADRTKAWAAPRTRPAPRRKPHANRRRTP